MPSLRSVFLVASLAFALPVSLMACAESGGRASSDDDSSAEGGGGGGAPEQVVTSISPFAGGTLSDSGVTLTVPPGAVDAETDVTLTVSSSADAKSKVFTFGPAGAGFTVPATVSIATTGLTPSFGNALAMGTQVDGEWLEMTFSEESSALETSITSLGTFAVIEVETASSECEATCMAQSGAVCCTTCGCEAAVWCQPTCSSGYQWDCEVECCFDYELQQCAS